MHRFDMNNIKMYIAKSAEYLIRVFSGNALAAIDGNNKTINFEDIDVQYKGCLALIKF